MANVLITGGTGFIGQHLICNLLEKTNHQLRVTSRNILISDQPRLTYQQIDNIDDTTNWHQALQKIDIVIHLAARAHILKESVSDPEAEFDKINNQATINLLQQSIKAGVKHFIFLSSIGAIATLSDTIINESSTCNPDTPYGRSKLKAEKAIEKICENTTMTWTIVRPTLVYGANNPGNMERLLALTTKSLPLPLGSIKNSRSFVYVGNLVDAIATCIDHPKAKNQIFIVSDGEDLSTPELIRHIGKAMNKSPLLLPFPPSLLKLGTKIIGKEDVGDRLLGSLQVDSSKIRQMLNWKPPSTMDEGLKVTADWFKNK
jgi:nucleoside-diphosphate-sugar epimerase